MGTAVFVVSSNVFITIIYKKQMATKQGMFCSLDVLGLEKTEEENTMYLRYLMCQGILSKSGKYQQQLGLTAEQLLRDVHAFRVQGWFNRDGVILELKYAETFWKYQSLLLPHPQAPYHSFVPPKISSIHRLYAAFNHSLPGYYDATTG